MALQRVDLQQVTGLQHAVVPSGLPPGRKIEFSPNPTAPRRHFGSRQNHPQAPTFFAEFTTNSVVGNQARLRPAHVDVDQVDAVLLQPLKQGRKDHFDKMIAIRVHVAERRGDEDSEGFLG